MEWFLKVVRDNYANFEGRARRKEFWMYLLIYIGISVVLGIVQSILGLKTPYLSSLLSLALLVPSLSVGARRLHDIGKSGWMQLIGLIPILGAIYLIVLFAKEGDVGDNTYGSDPKAGAEA